MEAGSWSCLETPWSNGPHGPELGPDPGTWMGEECSHCHILPGGDARFQRGGCSSGQGQEWKDCQPGSRRAEDEWGPLTKTLSVESWSHFGGSLGKCWCSRNSDNRLRLESRTYQLVGMDDHYLRMHNRHLSKWGTFLLWTSLCLVFIE